MAKKTAESQIASLIPDQKKSEIDLIYLATEGMQHTIEKFSMRTTTLLQIASWSEVYSQSYGASKLQESQLAWFWDSHLGVPGKKSHLDVGFVASHRLYYKGEGGGFSQVQAVVSLMCPCCPWFILTPKVLQLCTNHFVWVVCRLMWMNEVYQLFLVPSQSSNTPLYPSKCCELGSVPGFFPLSLSSTWTHIWILQRVGNASTNIMKYYNPKYTKN